MCQHKLPEGDWPAISAKLQATFQIHWYVFGIDIWLHNTYDLWVVSVHTKHDADLTLICKLNGIHTMLWIALITCVCVLPGYFIALTFLTGCFVFSLLSWATLLLCGRTCWITTNRGWSLLPDTRAVWTQGDSGHQRRGRSSPQGWRVWRSTISKGLDFQKQRDCYLPNYVSLVERESFGQSQSR